jgi:catechol 2,3-dioxygenase-like lactoylglutathione lyase family enzyme
MFAEWEDSMRQAMMMVGIVVAASVARGTVAAGQDGQGSANSQGVQIIGLGGTLTPIVGNLEEAARFYSDLAGLPSPPAILRRSHRDVPYPEVLKNQGTPDATIRQINLKSPNSTWSLEVLEFSELDRKSVSVRPQDPGAVTLVLSVRDLDGLLATLKRGTIRVVTPGGQPVPLVSEAARARAVLIQTADGHFVELQQPDPLPADAATAPGNVIGARVRVTIADTNATLRLYRDQLGLRAEAGTFTSDPSRLKLMGTAGAQFRVTSVSGQSVPGHGLELVEFKGIDRMPLHTRIQDPGSAKIGLRVRNLAATMAALKAAGGTVVTTGGTSYIYRGAPTVIVRDLNNMFMNMQEQSQSSAAGANR